jgi:signal peptidase II
MASERRAPNRLLAFTIAAAIFGLDRLTKWLIETRVSALDTHTVIPGFFDIVHSKNSGAAFGLFSNATSELRSILLVGLSVVALAVIGRMLWNASRLDRVTLLGLAMIFGGALGNVFDRLARGTVTDFLEFYVGNLHWPTFNLADSAIVVGSGLLLIELLKPKRQDAQT